MTLEEAQSMLRNGVLFGDVFPLVPEGDQSALREWFATTPGLPNLAARTVETRPSGDLCGKCGGLMVRTGTCLTCQSCGDSSGGCG